MSSLATVGDIVLLSDGQVGIVRFIGEIKRETGVYYGIDLSDPTGNTDGSWNGVYYFTTHDNFGIFIKKTGITKVIEENEYNLPRVTVGDIVGIKEVGCNAIIRFVGWTLFYPEVIWYGVQLEEEKGDNDGSIDDHKYFTCAPNYGLFVMYTHIIKQKKKKTPNKRKKFKKYARKKKATKVITATKPKPMEKQISFEEFMEDYEETQGFDHNYMEYYHEQFYFQVTNPFFRSFSEMFDNIPKQVIELILKYCTASIDTKSKDIKEFCVNIFSNKQCYYAILYSHQW